METVDRLHFVPVLYPVANAFAGTINTDIVECNGEGILFIVTKGVGTTGTTTLTIQACDNVTPSNTTAVAFMYRISTTPDTWGAWTQATATGFTTTAGSNQMYQLYVPAGELGSEGYEYARVHGVEVVASACVGSIIAAVVNTRYQAQPYSLID